MKFIGMIFAGAVVWATVVGFQQASRRDAAEERAKSLCASKHMGLYVDKKDRLRDLSLSKTVPCVDERGTVRKF